MKKLRSAARRQNGHPVRLNRVKPSMSSVCLLMLLAVTAFAVADDFRDRMAIVGPGDFHSVIPEGKKDAVIDVPVFQLDRLPVTNGEFLEFVKASPEWRRGEAVRLFVDPSYLSHWETAIELGYSILPGSRP